MPSPGRLVEGAHYHIFGRGTNRENIFLEERNYTHFMRLYEQHVAPVADTFAYCLLRNHFHFLVRIKTIEEIQTLKVSLRPLGSVTTSPSRRLSNFLNAYAKAINAGYDRTGSLFQHPFGRVPVTTDKQFWAVVAYIHQNPQLHGLVEDFRDWKWSSYGVILTEAPTQISREAVLGLFGGRQAYLELHNQWQRSPHGIEEADR